VPLAVGIAVGRIGCFLTGLDDHTYGLPTTLPWAVDFGDGFGNNGPKNRLFFTAGPDNNFAGTLGAISFK